MAKSGTRVGSRSKALGVEGSREVAEGKDLANRASGLTGRHMLVLASPQPGQAGGDTVSACKVFGLSGWMAFEAGAAA